MILSASRRTDIPAAYSDWFLNRLDEGFLLLRNPTRHQQVTRIPLNQDVIDCIVFWTKNAQPLLNQLHRLKNWTYYFQHTLTAYDNTIERNVPSKNGILQTFKALAQAIGPDRMVWRYDPVLLSPEITVDFHKKWFEELARRLSGHTHRCVVSLLDPYKKIEEAMTQSNLRIPNPKDALEIFQHFADVGAAWGIQIETCAEHQDFQKIGINPTKCIDDRLISKITGIPFSAAKDTSQRAACGCVPSIDIGAYGTCPAGCAFCYATRSHIAALKVHAGHDPRSALLCDSLEGDETIVERKMFSHFKHLAPELLQAEP
jgi:hypothetical protein